MFNKFFKQPVIKITPSDVDEFRKVIVAVESCSETVFSILNTKLIDLIESTIDKEKIPSVKRIIERDVKEARNAIEARIPFELDKSFESLLSKYGNSTPILPEQKSSATTKKQSTAAPLPDGSNFQGS